MAEVYAIQGKSTIALDYYLKAYRILFLKFGLQYPHTQLVYENIKRAYLEWNPKGNFKQWLEEKMQEDKQE